MLYMKFPTVWGWPEPRIPMVQRGPKPMLSQSLVCFAGKHLEALDGHWALLGGKPPAAGKNPEFGGKCD